jgi:hypothetical protein
MKLSDESAKRLLDVVQHTLSGTGPASMTLYRTGTEEPAAVVFVIPAPVGPLVDTFLNDLYMVLGWHVEHEPRREAN